MLRSELWNLKGKIRRVHDTLLDTVHLVSEYECIASARLRVEFLKLDSLLRLLHAYHRVSIGLELPYKRQGIVDMFPFHAVLGTQGRFVDLGRRRDCADAAEEYSEQIRSVGFDYSIEKTSVSSYKAFLTQIPNDLTSDAAVELWSTLTTRLSECTGTVESAAEGFFESRLWQASCKAAIKGGRVYDIAHIKWICDRLLRKPDSTGSVIRTCPHGRPVAVTITRRELEKMFGRIV